MGRKDHLQTAYSDSLSKNKETKRVLASSFIANPIALTEQVTDSGISIKTPSATQDFLQPLLQEIDDQVDNLATTIEVNLDKITAGFHRIQLPDVANVLINFINCPINRVLDFFLDFTKENPANTPTVTFNQTVNGLAQSDFDNNARLLVPIAARDTQDEIRFDAYGVSSGGGGGAGANVFLSNLVAPTAINQDLLFGSPGLDIANTINPVDNLFVNNVRLQEGIVTVNVPMMTSNANDDMIFNVPTLKSYIFREQNVLLGSIRGPAGDSVVDFDVIEANSRIKVNETGIDPIVNGIFTLNAGRVKVFTNGVLKDLTDIGTGAGGANTFLSNLTAPTAINQDLLFSATGFDIADTTNPVEDIFVERVRLQEGILTVNVPMITADSNDDMVLNVANLKSFEFREQGNLLGSIRGPFNSSVVDFDILEANLQIKVNETGVDPIVNGIFTLNGGRVKVFTNGVLKDLTDIGTGGGGGNQISQGDSNVTVTDAGGGQVDVTIDAVNLWRFLPDTLRPVTDNTVDIGTSSFRIKEFFVDRINIQDDQASNNPPANITTITADQSGIKFGVAANNDAHHFFFDGVLNLSIQEDVIEFEKVGRKHRIDAQGSFVRIASELQTDTIHLLTGTSRSNETVEIADTVTEFKTTTTQTSFYDVRVIQNNNTPATQREIGRFSGFAEDTSNSDIDYAHLEISTSNSVTAGSAEGRIALVNRVGGTLQFAVRCEGVSGAQRIGFFNATPVVQQNPAVNAAAIHAALQALGLFV